MYIVTNSNGFYAEVRTLDNAKMVARHIDGAAFVRDGETDKILYVNGLSLTDGIEKADFSVRTYNTLKRAGVDTIGELFDSMRLCELPYMSRRRYDEIVNLADACGEKLACEVDGMAVAAIAGLYAIAEREGVNLLDIQAFQELDSYIYDMEMSGQAACMDYDKIARYIAKIQVQFPRYKNQ